MDKNTANTLVFKDKEIAITIRHDYEVNELMTVYGKFYNALYEGVIETKIPHDDMVNYGKQIVCSDNNLVQSLVGLLIQQRGYDFFTSDRELVALVLAFYSYGLIQFPVTVMSF